MGLQRTFVLLGLLHLAVCASVALAEEVELEEFDTQCGAIGQLPCMQINVASLTSIPRTNVVPVMPNDANTVVNPIVVSSSHCSCATPSPCVSSPCASFVCPCSVERRIKPVTVARGSLSTSVVSVPAMNSDGLTSEQAAAAVQAAVQAAASGASPQQQLAAAENAVKSAGGSNVIAPASPVTPAAPAATPATPAAPAAPAAPADNSTAPAPAPAPVAASTPANSTAPAAPAAPATPAAPVAPATPATPAAPVAPAAPATPPAPVAPAAPAAPAPAPAPAPTPAPAASTPTKVESTPAPATPAASNKVESAASVAAPAAPIVQPAPAAVATPTAAQATYFSSPLPAPVAPAQNDTAHQENRTGAMLFPKVMFVNRGRAPTDAEMYDAFNVARASGDALESAFRDSKAAVTAEEVAAAEKVLVKGVAKLLRRLRRLGGAAYQYAKAMVAHIISWAKKSDLSTVPLDRAVDMEVREFFVLVNNLGVETFTPKWVPPPAHPIHVKPPTLKYPVHLPASVAKKLESRANAQIPALVTAVQKATYWRNVTDKAVAAAVVEVVTTAEHRGALVYYKTAAALLEALKPRETISPRSAGVAAGVVSRFMKRAIQYINGYNAKSLTTYKVSRWAQKLRPSKQNLRSVSRAMKKHWAEWKEETARIAHEKKTKADEADHFKKMHADEKRQKDEVKRKEELDHESQVKKVKEHTKKIYSERTSKMSESDRKHHAREKGRKAGFKLRAELRHKERVKRRMAREKARKARRKMREAARKARKAARAHERRFKDEREKERQREHAQWFARMRKVQQAHLKKYHLQLKALSSAYAKRLDGIKKRFKAAVAKVHAEHSKWLEDEAARQRELEAKWTLLKNRIQRENEQRGKMLEMWADKRIAQINEEAEKQAVAMYNQTFAEVYASTRGTDAEKHEAAVKAATLAGQREKENVLARLLAAHYAELARRKGSSRDLYEKLLKQLQKQFNAMKAKMLKRHKAAFMKRQQRIHLARKEALKQQAFILKAKQKREAAISKLKSDYQAFLGKIRGQVVQYKQEIERTAKREALTRRMASQKRWQKLQQHRMAAWKKLRDARLKQWEEWKKLREKDNELRFKAIKKHNDRVEHLKKLMQMRLHRRQVKHRESLRKRQREHRRKERRSKHHGKRRSELYRKRKARAERRRKRYIRHLHELKQLHEKAWKKHTRQFHRQEQRMKTRDKRRQARLKLESKRKALRRKRRENRIKRRLAHERHTKESKTKRVQAKVQRKEHHMKQADKDRLKKVEEDRKRQWEEYQAQRKADLEKIKDGISKSISEHAKLMKEKWEKLQKDSKGQWKTYSQQKAAIIAAEKAAQEAQQKQLKEQMESINKLVADVQNATGDKLKQQTDRLNREIKKVEKKFEKNVKDVTKNTKILIKKVVVPKNPSPLAKPTGLTAALKKQLEDLKKALAVIKKNVAKPVTLPKGPEVPRPNVQLQKSLGGLMVVYPKGRGKIRPVPTQPFIAPPPKVPSRPNIAPRSPMVGGRSNFPSSYRTLVPRTVVLPDMRRDVKQRVKVHHHVDYRRKPIGLPFIHPIAPRPQVQRKPRSHKPHRITIINKVQVNNRCSGSASASPGCANRNKPTPLPKPHLPAKYSFKVYSARFAAFKKARASYKKAVRRFKKAMKSVNRRTRLRAAKAFKAAKKRFLKIYSSYKQYYHIRRRVLRRYRRKLRAYRRRQADIQSWGLSAASAVKKVSVGGKKHKKNKKLKKTCASKLKKLKTSIRSAKKKYKVLRRASQCSSATCQAIKSKANAAAGQFKRLASKYFKLRSKCK